MALVEVDFTSTLISTLNDTNNWVIVTPMPNAFIPWLNPGDWFIAHLKEGAKEETIKVTQVFNGGSYLMFFSERGQNGTTAQSFNVNAAITTVVRTIVRISQAFKIRHTEKIRISKTFKTNMPVNEHVRFNQRFIIAMPSEPQSLVIDIQQPETPTFGSY